ncbi:undecaprenyldiphospho-muramoylpentapeptide beta-N-acetylglucosaminyltransferase [bacterium]|nr:undecaprenyldiphospho-muramoylpentapeptide beta-N-acetylglucosaminyltransferase [bacterium]
MFWTFEEEPQFPRRILIVAGGTGGHVAPALSVGSFLRTHFGDDTVVRYLSGSRGIERTAFDSADEFPVKLACDRPPRLSVFAVPQLASYARSILQSRAILRDFRPHAILAMGGYVCAPVLLAARMQRIPFFMHESNSVPGQVTRLFAKRARCVFLAHDAAARRLKRGSVTQVIGTPVRPSLLECNRPAARAQYGFDSGMPVALVLGGSQGARALNESMVEAIGHLAESCTPDRPLGLLWSAGPVNLKTVRDQIEGIAPDRIQVRLFDYIRDMENAYAASDLVISRAGASTLAEIAALGLPSILVPYPYAKDNHQLSNARALSGLGAAELLEESTLTGARMAETILSILHCADRREAMAAAAKGHSRPRAAEIIARELMDMPPEMEPHTENRPERLTA